MFSWFKKQKWALVKTLNFEFEFRRSRGSIKVAEGVLYIHLFESESGKRKYELSPTLASDPKHMDDFFKRTDVYNETVHRWLAGRVDPEIPRYNQISEEETANMLCGKVK